MCAALEGSVPSAAHWRSLAAAPDSFDASKVWLYTGKIMDEQGSKMSHCVFCLKNFGGHNATKMQLHQSGCHSSEIQTCIGCSNGQMPIWFRDKLKTAVVKKAYADLVSQTLIYEGHRREMAQISTDLNEMPLHKIWTEEESNYDLGLDKWDIHVDMNAEPKVRFNCFVEDWEEEAIKHRSGPNGYKLLVKYKNIRFYDEDESVKYKIIATNVEWKKKDKSDKETPCYCVLAKPLDDADDDDTNLASFHINQSLHGMIKHPLSGHISLELVAL